MASEDGGTLTARFYSVSDREGVMTVDPSVPVREAYLSDLTGRRLGACAVDGTVVTSPLAPHAVSQITVIL